MKKTYRISVDCANCAARIEQALCKLEGVDRASVQFLTQKLILETQGDPDALLPQVERAGKRVDGDFEILR